MINMFENLITLTFVIFRINQPMVLLFVITMFVASYICVIKPLQKTIKNYRKTHWANKRKLHNMSAYFNMQFQRRDINALEMNSFEQEIQKMNIDQDERNRIVHLPLTIVQLIILITVIYNNQNSKAYDILLVLGSFMKFDSVYNTIIRVANSYSSAQDQFQKLREKCTDNKFKKPYIPYVLYDTCQIMVQSSEIKRGNISINLNKLDLGTIGKQRITRFSGKSGNGKSSQLLAIAGQIEANVSMTVNGNQIKPEQLQDHILLVDQDLTNVGIYHLSINDLFTLASRRKMVRREYVDKALLICQIKSWASDQDWDKQIEEKISEGQKSRLLVSTQIYSALINPEIKIL